MTASNLSRRSGVAIRLALNSADWEPLLDYVAELNDPDLEELQEAAGRLRGAAGETLGRRHS